MTLYDLYIDDSVSGCIVFKTLSKRKVIDFWNYYIGGELSINQDELVQIGDCLTLSTKDRFMDYLLLYIRMMTSQLDYKVENELFHLSFQLPIQPFVFKGRIPLIFFGTTKNFQSFIIKMNIRNSLPAYDIYFDNGSSYTYLKGEVIPLQEKNQFRKLYKKYNLDKKGDS